MKQCLVGECPRSVAARGVCATHYKRWQRNRADYVLPSPMDPSVAGKLGAARGGSRGKKDGVTKGFAANPELARIAGARGGSASRRGPRHA